MTNQTVAKRYAKALFDIGVEQGKLDAFAASMANLAQMIEENEDVKKLLESYFVSISKKKELMCALLQNDDAVIRNFVCLILDKSRGMNLWSICKAFELLMEETENILHATVRSAVPLNPEQVAQIEQKFSSLTNQQVKAEVMVDESLIGGVVVRVGDKVYDGTLARQLSRMGKSLRETKM